jgi:hypothetical protein
MNLIKSSHQIQWGTKQAILLLRSIGYVPCRRFGAKYTSICSLFYNLNLCGGRIPKSVLWLWITVGRTTATSQIVRPMGEHQPDFPSIPRPSGLVIESSANKWKLCLPWNWLKFNPVVGKGLPKEKGTYLPTQSGSLWERTWGKAYQQICPNHQFCLFCG